MILTFFISKDGCEKFANYENEYIYICVCVIKEDDQDGAERDGGGCQENDDPQNGDAQLESNDLHYSEPFLCLRLDAKTVEFVSVLSKSPTLCSLAHGLSHSTAQISLLFHDT